ncbi:hypothetical protein PUN4_1940002 [Paraburkholderia unamae]|nr:hypothetical protein PUN4_1940002 [Paraburkholderia unamae]
MGDSMDVPFYTGQRMNKTYGSVGNVSTGILLVARQGDCGRQNGGGSNGNLIEPVRRGLRGGTARSAACCS